FTFTQLYGRNLFFSFYSKVILVLSFNTKILFLNKKYSFFTIIEKKR
ncbi:hypothetical protein HMPREF1377_01012, partial [Enterococcus faecium R494]